jgi:hypothetical protein
MSKSGAEAERLCREREQAKPGWFSRPVHPGICVLVITSCLALAVSELGLRLFLFQSFPDFKLNTRPTLGFQYDPKLGWFPVPNSHESFEFIHHTISMVQNSKGFRDIEPTFDKRPGVVFLGDSFVWGYSVDTDDRFTERLRRRHPDRQVYNFGVAGYGTDQEYLLLQQHFQEYHPRVVFLVFCTENDHTDNCSNGDCSWAFKPYFKLGSAGLELCGVPVPRSDRIFCLQQPILSKSWLIRLGMRAWGNHRSPAPPRATDPTTTILQGIRNYVCDHGAVFCVGLTGPDPQLECFLISSKIPYVDLSAAQRLEGDWHWSSEGNAFVAKEIERFLLDRKCL